MSEEADKYRDEAKHAGEKAKKAQSDDEGIMERKREKALTDMANSEDWLDGKIKPKPKAKT